MRGVKSTPSRACRWGNSSMGEGDSAPYWARTTCEDSTLFDGFEPGTSLIVGWLRHPEGKPLVSDEIVPGAPLPPPSDARLIRFWATGPEDTHALPVDLDEAVALRLWRYLGGLLGQGNGEDLQALRKRAARAEAITEDHRNRMKDAVAAATAWHRRKVDEHRGLAERAIAARDRMIMALVDEGEVIPHVAMEDAYSDLAALADEFEMLHTQVQATKERIYSAVMKGQRATAERIAKLGLEVPPPSDPEPDPPPMPPLPDLPRDGGT